MGIWIIGGGGDDVGGDSYTQDNEDLDAYARGCELEGVVH